MARQIYGPRPRLLVVGYGGAPGQQAQAARANVLGLPPPPPEEPQSEEAAGNDQAEDLSEEQNECTQHSDLRVVTAAGELANEGTVLNPAA